LVRHCPLDECQTLWQEQRQPQGWSASWVRSQQANRAGLLEVRESACHSEDFSLYLDSVTLNFLLSEVVDHSDGVKVSGLEFQIDRLCSQREIRLSFWAIKGCQERCVCTSWSTRSTSPSSKPNSVILATTFGSISVMGPRGGISLW